MRFLSPFVFDTFLPSTDFSHFDLMSSREFNRFAEDKDKYSIELEVPGFGREDLKIEVKDNRLKVSGEKKHKEGWSRKITQSYILPADANLDRIEAVATNGILSVSVFKKEEAKPKSITVQ